MHAAIAATLLTGLAGGNAGAASGDITRYAGTYAAGLGADGVPASSSQLNGPTGVAIAADGRVFIADRANNRIRVVALDRTVTTIVGGLLNPVDVAVDDAAQLLYFTEEGAGISRVSRVAIGGGGPFTAEIIAGDSNGYAGDGGPALAARFNTIGGIDVGPDGDVYVADRGNNRIRRIDVATDTISLLAGTGVGGGDNGPALSATFSGPKDVAVAIDGTVYVADEGTNLVRRITGGTVTVFAGNYTSGFSGDSFAATSAQLNSPDGVAVAPDGNVYIADTSNNRVRMVNVITGIISTVAGNGGCCGAGDGGPATGATVGNPIRVDVDSRGSIFIASEPEHAIRLVEAAPIVADAGGPYTIAEGADLQLDGSATLAGAAAVYAWDLDGDSVYDDATGVAPTISAVQLAALGLADGPAGPLPVALRVTESIDADTDATTLAITNVAPLASLGAPASATVGVAVTIDLGASDAGPVDAAASFTYRIDWDGDGVVDETPSGPAAATATHTYTEPGTVTLTLIAVDKDGAASAPVTAQVVVQAAATTTTTTTTSTTSTTMAPATTTTSTPTTAAPTVAPVLPATGQSTSMQTMVAAGLLAAGALLAGAVARRRTA